MTLCQSHHLPGTLSTPLGREKKNGSALDKKPHIARGRSAFVHFRAFPRKEECQVTLAASDRVMSSYDEQLYLGDMLTSTTYDFIIIRARIERYFRIKMTFFNVRLLLGCRSSEALTVVIHICVNFLPSATSLCPIKPRSI